MFNAVSTKRSMQRLWGDPGGRTVKWALTRHTNLRVSSQKLGQQILEVFCLLFLRHGAC